MPLLCRLLSVQRHETDQCLLRLALADVPIEDRFELTTANDPARALQLLQDPAREKPHLILMGWRFRGGESGLSFLRQLKSDPDWQAIPVLVLACGLTTDEYKGIYREQAAAVFEHPNDWPGLVHLVKQIRRFWLNVSQAPSLRAPCAAFQPRTADHQYCRTLSAAAGR